MYMHFYEKILHLYNSDLLKLLVQFRNYCSNNELSNFTSKLFNVVNAMNLLATNNLVNQLMIGGFKSLNVC